MGLLDTHPSTRILPRSWSELARLALAQRLGEDIIPAEPSSFASALSNVVPDRQSRERALDALQWLGLGPVTPSASAMASTDGLPPLPTKPTSAIDLLTVVLAHKLRYAPGERDLVVLSHEIVVAQPACIAGGEAGSPSETEVYTSSLVSYGTASASAMSRCVGLPVAFATLAVLDGKVVGRGVQGPTEETLYRTVLDGLQGVGLEMKEGVRRGSGMEARLSDGLRSTGFR